MSSYSQFLQMCLFEGSSLEDKVKNPKCRLKMSRRPVNHGIKAEFSVFSKTSQYYILRTVWRLEPEEITCILT